MRGAVLHAAAAAASTTAELSELPLLPLAAFFLLLNGGYFVAFTAVGGQSIGKMALGIKVITQEESAVPIGRATLRTLAYLVSALPLGAGFLPGVHRRRSSRAARSSRPHPRRPPFVHVLSSCMRRLAVFVCSFRIHRLFSDRPRHGRLGSRRGGVPGWPHARSAVVSSSR